jgi:hypothetical protein
MNADRAALIELRGGIAQWLTQVNNTINGTMRSNAEDIACTGEELTRQAWRIRNNPNPEPLVHRIDRLHTERSATIQRRTQ